MLHPDTRASLWFVIKVILISLLFLLCALVLHGLFHLSVPADSSAVSATVAPTVILDPGHGGRDGGAVSLTGTREKDLNLSLSQTLAALLESAGYRVILTRQTDIQPDTGNTAVQSHKQRDLQARLAYMEEYPDAVFVSIHMNTYPSVKYSGLQVFFSGNEPSSQTLAETVAELNRSLRQPENQRPVKNLGSAIYLLDKATVPAILVECGFLTHPEEAALLDTEDYRNEIACVLFCSLQQYFSLSS